MEETTLDSDPIEVMCVTATEGLGGVSRVWNMLESRLPSLKKRKFYGTFHYPDGPYRACVAIAPGASPEQMGLERWTIPGGRYARRKLIDWQANTDKIGLTFNEMSEEYTPDRMRPSIEFYRSQKELVLYLPIRGAD
jgi:hypothetical protein